MRKPYKIRLGPFLSWREGRPRFVPGPRERHLGFKGEDLRHGAEGRWFTAEEARNWGIKRHAEIEAARQGAPVAAKAVTRETVQDLLRDFINSDDFRGHAESTRRKNLQHQRWLIHDGPDASQPGALALCPARYAEPADIKAAFETWRKRRGLTSAKHMVMLLSAAYKWARLSSAWRLNIANPCHRLGLPSPDPRVFVWTTDAILHMVQTADSMGLPFIGDAIYLGVFSGQRQGDRLKMVQADLEQELMFFRQGKTSVIVEIPQIAALERRLTAAKERRRQLPHRIISANVIIDETTGKALTHTRYFKQFRKVKRAAIESARQNGDAFMAAHLAKARDQDLRDTIVTWLAREGASIIQIKSITGHSLASIMTTIKHYLAIDSRMSREAMDLLQRWMDREKIAL